jgi:zinc/manganese transport system substrate-binding protein
MYYFKSVLPLLFLVLFSCFLVAEDRGAVIVNEAKPVKVVATFSVLADVVKAIGKEHISVYSLVDWNEDAHVFNPSPRDVKHLANADLLVMNGLGFEGWLARLTSAAKYKGLSMMASEGVSLIRLEGDDEHEGGHHHHHHAHEEDLFDPHAWHSLDAMTIYVKNMLRALQTIDSQRADDYQRNADVYLSKMSKLQQDARQWLADIPLRQRHIVVPHNAFAYLAREYSLQVHSLQGLSTESETSAAQIADIVRQVRAYDIKAIFAENISDDRLIKIVRQETGVSFAGKLISGALSSQKAPSYLDMMEYNLKTIKRGLLQE